MKPSDIAGALRAIIPSKQPELVLGPPGIGKTSLVFQAAAEIYNGGSVLSTVGGLPNFPWFVPISATDKDPVDLKGLPYVVDGATRWTIPDIISQLDPAGGVLCLEELPQATPAVQCVLRELLLDRSIGRHRIPDTWTVVATGNRQEDRAGAGKLLTHVASSVVILNMEVSVEDWQAWALQAGISSRVRSFINFRPGLLHKFDAMKMKNTDPRGWERVSIIQDRIPAKLRYDVFSGCVDEGPAAEYIAFCQLADQLPDPQVVLANPDTTSIPSEPAVLYALTGALAEAARKANNGTLTNLAKYAARMPAEFATLLMRDTLAVQPSFMSLPAAQTWLKDNRDLLLAK